MTESKLQALAWAGGIIALALCASFARRLGYVDSDTGLRVVLGVNGLIVAWYGNRMPKKFVPSARARQAARVGGWSMVLSGVAYALLWIFAPIQLALLAGSVLLVAAVAVTFGYCLALRAKARAA
jgi:hypothetical protein